MERITGHFSYSAKFRGNVKILRQRANSVAWLEIPRPAENCGPYKSHNLLPSIHSSPPSIFISDFFIIQSITIANSSGDNMQPWWNTCDNLERTSHLSCHSVWYSFCCWIMVTMLSGIPYCLRINNSFSQKWPHCRFLNNMNRTTLWIQTCIAKNNAKFLENLS